MAYVPLLGVGLLAGERRALLNAVGNLLGADIAMSLAFLLVTAV